MKEKWIYTLAAKPIGPVSAAKIADLVLKGELDTSDSVQSSATGIWKPISSVEAITDIINKPMGKPLVKETTAKQLQKYINQDAANADAGWIKLKPILVVESWKLLPVWNILSLGLYELIWLFRKWYYLYDRDKQNKKRISIIRTSLMILVLPYVIFDAVYNEYDFRRSLPAPFHPVIYALIWYLAAYLTVLKPATIYPVVYWALSVLGVAINSFLMMRVQRYINDCNQILGRT